jgi:cation transport ATPase
VIDEVRKDSVSQIVTKIETDIVSNVETKNDIITEELKITPLDTCKDIVIDGKVYKNVVLTYKKTKDRSIHTEKKIVSKIEDNKQSTKTVEKLKTKKVERTYLNWLLIVIISLIIVVWLNKQYLLGLLRRM